LLLFASSKALCDDDVTDDTFNRGRGRGRPFFISFLLCVFANDVSPTMMHPRGRRVGAMHIRVNDETCFLCGDFPY
jgi:hypothetical protein